MVKLKAMLLIVSITLWSGTLIFAGPQQKVTLRVDGLACPFCAYGLEKKLKRLEGVEKLDIKINEGVVILYFKEGAKIDKQVIAKKVKEAGFTPRELQIESESKKEAEAMKGQKITLSIKGMACEGCVSRVKMALNSLDCVHDVEVSLSAEKAWFICTDDKTDPAKFVQAIEKLGFKAKVAGKRSELNSRSEQK
ncbi:MAG: heavy-metal-associated domain-containing protein [bacterium]